MDSKKKFHRSLKTLQLLPIYRYKYTSNTDIASRGLYNFCEYLLVFEGPEARDKMMNKKKKGKLTNSCFLALNHTEELMSVKQSMKSKIAQVITTENKAVIMLDHLGKISIAFNIQIAEPMFEFCHSLLIPVAINTSQWNCCLDNMAVVLHFMDDTECEDFFRMNMDKDWS